MRRLPRVAWVRLKLLRMLTVKSNRKTIPHINRRDGQCQGDRRAHAHGAGPPAQPLRLGAVDVTVGGDAARDHDQRGVGLAVQAAENGQGIALARSWLVADALETRALCRIGSARIPAGAAYFLVLPRDAQVRQEVREFTAWLRSQAANSGYTARPFNEESR